MEDCNLLHSITADRGISDHEETKDFFIFQNIAKIDTNVANTNFCNIFVAKKCCMKFRVFLTCCKAHCCKLFAEKIDVAKAYVANILANYQCCKHKIEKNVAKKITYGSDAHFWSDVIYEWPLIFNEISYLN